MGGVDRGSARRVTAGMMALIGAGLFFVLLAGELPGRESADWDDLPTGIVVRYIVTMALGSAVAGWLLAGLFGRRGAAGWLLALLGAVAATMVAGLLGSALGSCRICSGTGGRARTSSRSSSGWRCCRSPSSASRCCWRAGWG